MSDFGLKHITFCFRDLVKYGHSYLPLAQLELRQTVVSF